MGFDRNTRQFIDLCRQLFFWRIIIRTPANGSTMLPMQDWSTARVLFDDDNADQHRATSNADVNLLGTMKAATEQIQTAVSSLAQATSCMATLAASLNQVQSAADEKIVSVMEAVKANTDGVNELVKFLKSDQKNRGKKGANGDKAIEFNWMLGHGTAPKRGKRATSDQNKFERLKVHMKANATWFVYNSTPEELAETWIEFRDTPMASVDGLHLKQMLCCKEEMDENMGQIVVRILRNDESEKRADVHGNCHFVLHTWADQVMDPNSTMDSCEEIFLAPQFQYDISNCGKVVAMIKYADCWASVSIDMIKCITYLIHPALSANPHHQVLEVFQPSMQRLTEFACAHIKNVTNRVIPEISWKFDVALKKQHIMHGPDTGVSTAYFSVPKVNQFLSVTPDTIYLAKLTFIYKGIIAAYTITKKTVQGGKKLTTKKRKSDGAVIQHDKKSFYTSDGGNNVPPEQAFSYLV